ncbi:hypothetical protein IG193_00695 [Infirmifilum lucidum]|uniref:Uncharacterized protein n=1 Tax=Infirmifilum lucidum TaxID=2776706 RepID=A0A7L9FGY5_9CREN|nr:hypothetical protein [Infirmifilum lucidum]QOJ79019.1 hypothetical protein IG193_00695 [Infirmifilum lucidum]
MMLQWEVYSRFAPQLGGGDKLYNRDFPWYNSTQLKALYPDKNELRAALYFLFYMPFRTYHITDESRPFDGVFIYGIEGARVGLLDGLKYYQKIAGLYPNGTIGKWNEDPRLGYYGWLDDRFHHRVHTIVGKYLGFSEDFIRKHLVSVGELHSFPEFLEEVNKTFGMDQFLTRNWKYWDLLKFVCGYWYYTTGDNISTDFTIPQTLRIFGFPTAHINIEPSPKGAGPSDWAVSLPYPIAKSLQEEFPNNKILYGPGYTFGLFNCSEEGLIKDGIKKVYVFYFGDVPVYLMKKS